MKTDIFKYENIKKFNIEELEPGTLIKFHRCGWMGFVNGIITESNPNEIYATCWTVNNRLEVIIITIDEFDCGLGSSELIIIEKPSINKINL